MIGSSTETREDLLDAYTASAAAKSERTGKPPASRAQVAKILSLLERESVSGSERKNTRETLRVGVSKKHAGVLIDKLLGTFGQPKPTASNPRVAAGDDGDPCGDLTASADDIDAAIAAAMAVENEERAPAREPQPTGMVTGTEPLPWDDPAYLR